MFGWRVRLLVAAALSGIIGLLWLQDVGRVDAQGTNPAPELYVNVVAADDLSNSNYQGSSPTVLFHPITARIDDSYTAYISNWLGVSDGIDPRHLDSAATAATQMTIPISYLQGEGSDLDVRVFCGTDSGPLIFWAKIPLDRSSTSLESSRGLAPGTYSLEPPLTSLTPNTLTLTPALLGYTNDYSALDLTQAGKHWHQPLWQLGTAQPQEISP